LATKTKTLALVASISATNVAFRIILAGGPPNIKPIAFLVIVGGIVGGPIPGLSVGWLSMTLSDLYFGAGVWTIETSACMAGVGLLAGFSWHGAKHPSRWNLALGGFFLTMFFDVGTSLADALLFNYPWWTSVLALYIPFVSGGFSPYPFGVVHELTTALLLSLIGPSLISQIRRFYW
jgi:uncharacterized membrane protein